MNIIGANFAEIPVTVEGEGLHGVVRALKAAGYYAAVLGNLGDVMVIYGPQAEHLNSRVPCVALIGDTIRVPDRSADCQEHQHTNRQ